ncbi:MAG: Holliday junction resolvase RuvX [Chloroflexi bacterium]|nr:Holliday junction resolvase RuvX [Chloroflexota bacterium]
MHRIMGLDIGDRRIGIAVSDPTQTLASPLKTIIRKDDESAVLEITALLKQYDIGRLVIGLPYLLDGSVGEQAHKVMDFNGKIKGQITVETVMQDERLTSVTAGQKLREGGKKLKGKIDAAATGRKFRDARKKRERLRKEIDAAAATVILQAYLDEISVGSQISQQAPPSL